MLTCGLARSYIHIRDSIMASTSSAATFVGSDKTMLRAMIRCFLVGLAIGASLRASERIFYSVRREVRKTGPDTNSDTRIPCPDYFLNDVQYPVLPRNLCVPNESHLPPSREEYLDFGWITPAWRSSKWLVEVLWKNMPRQETYSPFTGGHAETTPGGKTAYH